MKLGTGYTSPADMFINYTNVNSVGSLDTVHRTTYTGLVDQP